MKCRAEIDCRSGSSVISWLVAATLLVVAQVGQAQSGMAGSIQSLMTKYKLESALVSYRIEDARTGEVLAESRSNRALIPASNMKVLTSGAALAVLGPDFQFRTTIHRQDGVVTIVGSGDPSLGDPDVLSLSNPPLNIDSLLERLANAATTAESGPISRVVVDARIFDRELVHPSWNPNDLSNHYAAQVSGLNIHTNNLWVFTAPASSPSGRPTITTQPRSPWIPFVNEARTEAQGSNTAWVSRSPGTNSFKLHGTVTKRESWPIRAPLHEPGLYAGQLLAQAIQQQAQLQRASGGGAAAGLIEQVSLLDGDARSEPGPLVAVVTTPLLEVLTRCNRDSQNMYAEALLKRIGTEITGRPGSWKDGAAVVRMLIAERIGPDHAARTTVSDGSGLSRDNLIAPDTMNAWIRSFYNAPALRDHMFNSMAIPGEGTFTRRFQNAELKNRVRGKSGTLTGVRTISGLITHPVTGRSLIYTIFVNQGQTGSVGVNARDFSDEVVSVADRWLTDAESAAALGG